MTAFETRIQLQALLGVKSDGDLGPKSRAAWDQLTGADPQSSWPPVAGAAFSGQYTPALRDEYSRLYSGLIVRDGWQERIEAQRAEIAKGEDTYSRVGDALCARGNRFGPLPWHFIGIIHSLEGGCDFHTHLHNGDPLTARTVHEPTGRPSAGSPPFTWIESALDALLIKGLHKEDDWTLPRMLFNLEKYNGFGYRRYHPEVLSPYLWSGTNHYRVGKYVADGTWNPEAASAQVGAAALLHAFGYR